MKDQPYEYRQVPMSNSPIQTVYCKCFDVLQNIYLNPFDPNLKIHIVYNFSSGSEISIPGKNLNTIGRRKKNGT